MNFCHCKGKIKIKRIEDNTAAEVEILIHLPSGLSPDKTIDALYAFTACETSISPLGFNFIFPLEVEVVISLA